MSGTGVREDALNDAASRTWDALVIGAGPAGALAAANLARLGHSVLLVDAKEFPRDKVCGGCLNARGQALLAHCGLDPVIAKCDSMPVETLQMVCGRRRAEWAVTGMVALNRAQFDHELVGVAVTSGACFCSRTSAQVLTDGNAHVRMVQLRQGLRSVLVVAKVVLVADGLARSSLRLLDGLSSRVASGSRVGLGTVVDDYGTAYPQGRLTMAVSPRGYVGVTRTAGDRLTVAAAVDADRLTSTAPAEIIDDVLTSCRLPVPASIAGATWCGTPALTRRGARFAARRLFVLGDAIGYVEPFTGEGMSSALLTSILSIPFAQAAIADWHDALPGQWEGSLQRKVLRESWTCRHLSQLVRRPLLAGLSLAVCRRIPSLPRSLSARVGARAMPGLPPIVRESCCPESGPHCRPTGSPRPTLPHARRSGSTEPIRGH